MAALIAEECRWWPVAEVPSNAKQEEQMCRLLALSVAVSCFLLQGPPDARAADAEFKCPVAMPLSSSAASTGLAQRLSDRTELEDPARLDDLIVQLRAGGMSNPFVVDHLAFSYCSSIVGNSALSVQAKTALMRQFLSRVTRQVYLSNDVTSIVLDVTVTPNLVARIDDAATKVGQSREAWIVEAIQARLPKVP